VTFLGHAVSEDGISKRKEPANLEELRSFLGMTGYYRGHIKNYAYMASPLHALTKKNAPWKWEPDEAQGYRCLLNALVGDTILGHLKVEDERWVLDTDASGYALGAVLSQVQDWVERVIRFASKNLSPEQR
jgi:hypothetical protein